jgi:hypothetical protein
MPSFGEEPIAEISGVGLAELDKYLADAHVRLVTDRERG